MKQNNYNTLTTYWFDLLFMLVIFFISVCGMNDPLFLFGLLSALFLIWKWRKKTQTFTLIDKLLIIIWLYYVINIFISTNSLSSFFQFRTLTFGVIYYFLLRICCNNVQKIKTYLFAACMVIAALCAVSYITFLIFRSTCNYVGFTEIYDFRNLYKPLGYLSNVWGSMLIGFTGITLLTLNLCRKERGKSVFLLFLFALLSFNLMITFSRGVYLSFAFLLLFGSIFLLFAKMKMTRKYLIFAAMVLPLLVCGFIHKQEVSRIFQFNQSISQQRSISGRAEGMSFAYELFKKSPLAGTGTGSYSQVINNYRYEDDNNSFTNFAPNGYVQLLTEQGIIGFILWGALLVAFFLKALKKRKDSSSVITMTIIMAVLIREVSFPVLLGSGGFQLLIFTFLAVSQNILQDNAHKNEHPVRYFPVCILGITLLICGYSVFYLMDEQNNRKALSAMEKGELEEAERYMCKTTERIPYLINRSTVNKILYDKTKDASYLKNATMYLEKATLKNSHDSMIRYYLALVLREQGNSDSALHIVQELADRFPNKSLYRLSVFSMLYENGQQEASFSHLLQAVKLSPDYLDSPYLKEILLKNTALNESLRHRLLQDISADISGNNPILLAKEGKIYLSLSRENEARQCFEKAILLLPNLIYPHYYLCKLEAIILEQKMIYLKQFVFLNSGNISKDAIDQMITSGSIEKIVRNKSYFQDPSYSAKFQTWYHSAILHSSSF